MHFINHRQWLSNNETGGSIFDKMLRSLHVSLLFLLIFYSGFTCSGVL